MKLFEYAIIFNPKATKEQIDNAVKPKSVLVKDVTTILATDDKEAMLLVAREIPAEYLDKLEQVDITVRPF